MVLVLPTGRVNSLVVHPVTVCRGGSELAGNAFGQLPASTPRSRRCRERHCGERLLDMLAYYLHRDTPLESSPFVGLEHALIT